MTLAKVNPDIMNNTKLLAIALLVVGIAALAYQGFSYTTRENVVDLGPIHVTAEKTHSLPLPPIVGGIAVIAGIALLAAGSRKG